jgi:hypothetical protein
VGGGSVAIHELGHEFTNIGALIHFFVDGGFNKTNLYLRNGVSLETPFLLYDHLSQYVIATFGEEIA